METILHQPCQSAKWGVISYTHKLWRLNTHYRIILSWCHLLTSTELLFQSSEIMKAFPGTHFFCTCYYWITERSCALEQISSQHDRATAEITACIKTTMSLLTVDFHHLADSPKPYIVHSLWYMSIWHVWCKIVSLACISHLVDLITYTDSTATN